MKVKLAIVIILVTGFFELSNAQLKVGIETGVVFTGYNDARVPGDVGTKFSLKEDIKGHPFIFYRINASYTLKSKHNFILLFAPLQTTYKGIIYKDIFFANTLFVQNTDIKATYKFNSYRFTYRYDFIIKPKIEFGLGFTAKVRDAKIALSSSIAYDEKTNIGFVPIINFRLVWHCVDKLSILLQGDALAAPKGRAEDVLIAVTYDMSEQFQLLFGYRTLEGGGDVKSVYSFANFNYATIGLTYTFNNK